MAFKVKDNARASLPGSDKNELFETFDGKIIDSSRWSVIHSGLDTVRQLYAGLLIPEVVADIERVYNEGFGLAVEVGGFEWIVSTGGRSGYRYTLKNPNIGLVILVGSNYMETKYNGHHLKIQCSPVFLLSRPFDDVQIDMDHFASKFMTQLQHSGVAVHLCADVQGWVPPNDLDSKLTTKAKRVVKFSGIQSLEFDFNETSVVYGKGETFTFGSASTLQLSVYDKYKAVKAKGELPLWLPVWSQSEQFDEKQSIFRVEIRFHQNVIDQFSNGTQFQCTKLADLKKHLPGLWAYGLNNFRFDDSKTYINPFWQWLRDDLNFEHLEKLDLDYRRLYKAPADDGVPSDRSISICFGQLASIYGRNGYTLKKAANCLMDSGIWLNLADMYQRRGLETDDIFNTLAQKLERFQKRAA